MATDRRDADDRPHSTSRRDREAHREPRGGRGRDRGFSPNDRRMRSRSPRDRGHRRDRHRSPSRSPTRRDDREGRGRGGRDTDRRYRRGDRDIRSHEREVAKGTRGPPSGPRKDFDRGADSRRIVKYEDDDPDIPMESAPNLDLKGKPEGMDDETWAIYKIMGFARFKSTKNTKVPGNSSNYAVRKDKTMVARQYMNRQGGFNRPLSPSRGS